MFLMIDRLSFSEWLIERMRGRGLSQSDLARQSGLHRAVISKIVNQVSSPTPETIEGLARGLQLPPEEVFRAAGLLPPASQKDSRMDELDHLAAMLNPEDLQDLIDYARLRLTRRRERDEKPTYKQKSSRSIRPARSALNDK